MERLPDPVMKIWKPPSFLYFLAGVEIGVALVGGLAFAGLEAIAASRQRFIDQQQLPPRT